MVRTMDPEAPGYAGFKDYSPRFLRVYDWWVLGVMARAVWRTPVQPMADAYSRHVGQHHLEVGPGTGYLLAVADLPADVEITLLDANPHVLAHASRRLAGWDVVAVEANVLEPLPLDGPFDSAGLSNVLHCLPGPMAAKASPVGHVAEVLGAEGVLIGSTLLGLAEPHTWAARSVLKIGNRKGAFDNLEDTADGLRRMLEASFSHVEIEVAGSIARFEARNPR